MIWNEVYGRLIGTESVDSPVPVDLLRWLLISSNLNGSHEWSCSADSRSASQVALVTVTKQLLQIESVVPSGLRRRTKLDLDDAMEPPGNTSELLASFGLINFCTLRLTKRLGVSRGRTTPLISAPRGWPADLWETATPLLLEFWFPAHPRRSTSLKRKPGPCLKTTRLNP